VAQSAPEMGVEVVEVAECIAEQIDEVVPVMVVRHRPAEWWEETFRRIGQRIIRRGRDQTEFVPVPPQYSSVCHARTHPAFTR
jgi:hypothetical protein